MSFEAKQAMAQAWVSVADANRDSKLWAMDPNHGLRVCLTDGSEEFPGAAPEWWFLRDDNRALLMDWVAEQFQYDRSSIEWVAVDG